MPIAQRALLLVGGDGAHARPAHAALMSSRRQANRTASPSAGIASPVFWRITVDEAVGVSTWKSQ